MQAFRELIKGWLGKFLLGIIVLVFGAFGTESLLSIATRPQPPVEVNGEPILQASLDRTMEFQRQRLQQRFGKDMDPSLVEADKLRPQAIDLLVEKELLLQYSKENNFRISRAGIAKWIMSMPQFQQDGVFSKDLYNRAVSRLGYSPSQLEDELMKDLLVAQVRTTITNSAFLTDHELENMARLEAQTRDLSYILLDHKKFVSEVNYSNEELKAHYDGNLDLYTVDEQVKVEYIELKAADYLAEAKQQITQEDIEVAYNEFVSTKAHDEERHAAHILVEITDDQNDAAAKKKIEEALAKIESGESFSTVAKEYSDDIGSSELGGDLGWAKRGDFVGPFEDALYQLEVDEVSKPIQSEFGYHIIKLAEIKKPEIPSLESMKVQLAQELASEEADQRYLEQVEMIADIAFKASDLTQPAELAGRPVLQSGWITRRGGADDGIFSKAAVLRASFSDEVIKQDHNSEVIDITEDFAIILRKLDYKAESITPFAKVKDEIVEKVKLVKAGEMAMERGQQVIAKLKNNATENEILALIKDYQKEIPAPASKASDDEKDDASKSDDSILPWKTEEGVGRFSAKVDRDITDALFELSKPEKDSYTFGGVVVQANDYAVLKLIGVDYPDSDKLEEESKTMARFLSYQLSQLEFQDFHNELKREADIVVN